jgi:hypothetical protein
MALAVSKYIEIKTNLSIRAFLTEFKKITDAKLLNKINKKIIVKRVPLSVKVSMLLEQLKIVPH